MKTYIKYLCFFSKMFQNFQNVLNCSQCSQLFSMSSIVLNFQNFQNFQNVLNCSQCPQLFSMSSIVLNFQNFQNVLNFIKVSSTSSKCSQFVLICSQIVLNICPQYLLSPQILVFPQKLFPMFPDSPGADYILKMYSIPQESSYGECVMLQPWWSGSICFNNNTFVINNASIIQCRHSPMCKKL